MEQLTPAVRDVLACSDAIEKRRRRQAKEEAQDKRSTSRTDDRGRSRAKMESNRDLREQYMAVLQRRDSANRHASHAARVRTLQRMVVMQGLPPDAYEYFGGSSRGTPQEEEKCSLRGLVWKVLLGAYHIDSMLYVRLVEQGASWKDYLIRQDTFRTFKGDEAFRKRVPEAKLSRLNNAFVRLNFPEQPLPPTVTGSVTAGGGGMQNSNSSNNSRNGGSNISSNTAAMFTAAAHDPRSASPSPLPSPPASAPRTPSSREGAHFANSNNTHQQTHSSGGQGNLVAPNSGGPAAHTGAVPANSHTAVANADTDGSTPVTSSSTGASSAHTHGHSSAYVGEEQCAYAKAGSVPSSTGGYVQGMTILCAPFLFVMPEVDAFFCFNALLTRHLPRYVTPTLDGVHAGCALIGRVLQVVDPELHGHLSGRAGDIKIFAFPLLMSLHACMPPLEETLKVWDVLFAYGVHLEVLLAAAQCILVRSRLLGDPNPYNQLNFRIGCNP